MLAPRTRHPSSGAAPRRAVLVALAVFVVLLAGVGCASADNEPILTVDGWELGRHDFLVELDEIARNQAYIDARRANGQPFTLFKPGSNEEYTPEVVAEFLNERVTFRLAEAEVARRNLVVTAEDRARAVEVIVDGLSPGTPTSAAAGGTSVPGSTPPGSGVDDAAGRRALDAFGTYREVLINGVAHLQVLQRALAGDLTTDDALRRLYDEVKDRFAEETCARHILVRAGSGQIDPKTGNAVPASEAEYLAALDELVAIKDELDAGADFATMATRRSEDAATSAQGGDLGCAPREQYSGDFEKAVWSQPVGLLSIPVKSTFGYHLILVTERRTRTFDEVKDELKRGVEAQSEQALTDWLATATKAASVTVDPQFGRWNPGTGVIDPAGGGSTLGLVPDTGAPGSVPAPPSTTTTAPAAVPAGPSAGDR